jgi:peptide-methionine (R)-S-oxide reductase
MVTRRQFLVGGAAGAAGLYLAARVTHPSLSASSSTSTAGQTFEVVHTDAEWRKLLTADQYAVLRQEFTEPPFSSKLLHESHSGTFLCAGCALPLFESSTKFDSGTGWPSFYAPIKNAVGQTRDTSLGMIRDAVHCHRCGGHLGHVFDDGPKPTGLRYCINGLALTFKAS